MSKHNADTELGSKRLFFVQDKACGPKGGGGSGLGTGPAEPEAACGHKGARIQEAIRKAMNKNKDVQDNNRGSNPG